MKVVVGLGNPGKRYADTRHNVGYAVIDELARELACRLRRSLRFRARTGRGTAHDADLLLVQPETYMNHSGIAVAAILRYRKVAPSDLVVVLDDADLGVGQLRIRPSGGDGGHRGLSSIILSLQTQEFARIRIGIGRHAAGQGLIEHVLTTFSAEEREPIARAVARAAEAVFCISGSGVEPAMNRFNGMRE